MIEFQEMCGFEQVCQQHTASNTKKWGYRCCRPDYQILKSSGCYDNFEPPSSSPLVEDLKYNPKQKPWCFWLELSLVVVAFPHLLMAGVEYSARVRSWPQERQQSKPGEETCCVKENANTEPKKRQNQALKRQKLGEIVKSSVAPPGATLLSCS